jgi:hypothetical protein
VKVARSYTLQGVLKHGAGTGPVAGGPSISEGETSGSSTLDFDVLPNDTKFVAILTLNATTTPSDIEIGFWDPSKQTHRIDAGFNAAATKNYTFDHPLVGTWEAEIDPRGLDADVGYTLNVTVT